MFGEIMAAGVDDYMKKPFSMGSLRELLEKHIP
jgi:DNA-binding response OmpR family regulator